MSKSSKDLLADVYREVVGELSIQPSEVKGQCNTGTNYYRKKLMQTLMGNFVVSAPEEWDVDYILQNVILEGKVAIVNTEVGIIPQKCGLSGFNIYNRPTGVRIASPILGKIERTVGEDACLVYLNGDYRSLDEMLRRYAQRLANCDISINTGLMNTRVSAIFNCADKNQAETAKRMYDKISAGEPAIFLRKQGALASEETSMVPEFLPIRNAYVVDLIQEEKRLIIEEFLTEIGINNLNIRKKERSTVDEVNSNNDELESNVWRWQENLQKCCRQIKQMFGVDVDMQVRSIKRMNEQKEVERNVDLG